MREVFGLRLALVGIGLSFVATPLGFYSRCVGSETIMLGPCGVILYQTVRLAKDQSVNWLVTCQPPGRRLVGSSKALSQRWEIRWR